MSGGDRKGLPIRRHSFRAADFAAYLAANGAEIGTPTNVYEVIRYKAFWQGGKKAITHIVYAKENGLLTYTGGSADHYRAFQSAGSIEVDESRVRRKALGHLRPKRRARGTQHGLAKLNPDAVKKIRQDTRKQRDIAAEYGVSQTAIYAIKRGKTWGHIV